MTALALSLVSNPTLLAIMGGVLAALVAFLKGNSRGAAKERAKQAQAEQKARQIVDEVDNDLSTLTPAQRRKRLGKWS